MPPLQLANPTAISVNSIGCLGKQESARWVGCGLSDGLNMRNLGQESLFVKELEPDGSSLAED